MSTEAQQTANQANAKLSTGPRTAEGLASIAHNNLRHGLASTFVVLPTEDRTAYDDLLLNLNLEFSPSTESEEILVTKMAQHHWQSQRAMRLQNDLFLEAAATTPEQQTTPDPKRLALYLRYETTHDRAYHKALSQLLRLRADRRRNEIGFESQKARNELQQARLSALAARAETEKIRQQEALRASERKEELHQQKLRKAEADASYAEFEDYAKRTMEAPIPGNARYDYDRIHRILNLAVQTANTENRAQNQKEAA